MYLLVDNGEKGDGNGNGVGDGDEGGDGGNAKIYLLSRATFLNFSMPFLNTTIR